MKGEGGRISDRGRALPKIPQARSGLAAWQSELGSCAAAAIISLFVGRYVVAFGAIPRLGRRELFAVAVLAVLILAFLSIVVRKAVWLRQGDVQVFFRAGWAVWTGYPLYQVTDQHGWT
jgi:hypothetical protein